MNRLSEQHYAVKFCVRLGETASENHGMIKTAYGVMPWVDQVSLGGTNCFGGEKSKFKMSNGWDQDHGGSMTTMRQATPPLLSWNL